MTISFTKIVGGHQSKYLSPSTLVHENLWLAISTSQRKNWRKSGRDYQKLGTLRSGKSLRSSLHQNPTPALLAVASSPSPAERAAFMAFALQRIRAVSLKGTCAIILARPVSRTAPGGVHRRGALPLIQPKPRPRVAAFVSPPPRPQSQAVWAGASPRRPDALGPSRGACSCGHSPTPSAPDAWP